MLGFIVGVNFMGITSILIYSYLGCHDPKSCYKYNHTPEEVYENQLEQWKKEKPIKESEQ